jgi:hypothetical protein
MSKILLFYSEYCQYSKNLLEQIAKNDLRGEFLNVCIDSASYNIPKFVTKVPMLYSKENNRVLVEDEIMDYVDILIKKKASIKQEDVQYYSQVEMDNKFSDNFSFLNDENQKRSFVFLNEDNTFNDNIIKQSNKPVKEDEPSNRIDSATIEKYMMKRDADFNSAMQTMQRKNI